MRWLPAPEAGLGHDLQRRSEQVARQIRRDGITHNVFGEHGAAQRPWPLELLPLIIDPAEWAMIEAGVVQRATLLQAMLADLYGPQTLLHDARRRGSRRGGTCRGEWCSNSRGRGTP
jgi:uncharacterized circularly permuted ATP-grasp superfamily protein